jgi:hypothetical protein
MPIQFRWWTRVGQKTHSPLREANEECAVRKFVIKLTVARVAIFSKLG